MGGGRGNGEGRWKWEERRRGKFLIIIVINYIQLKKETSMKSSETFGVSHSNCELWASCVIVTGVLKDLKTQAVPENILESQLPNPTPAPSV